MDTEHAKIKMNEYRLKTDTRYIDEVVSESELQQISNKKKNTNNKNFNSALRDTGSPISVIVSNRFHLLSYNNIVAGDEECLNMGTVAFIERRKQPKNH